MESFSLNCEPFASAIDNRFFYGGTTLMQRLDLLSHLTQFGDSIVLVSGPTGSGKTTLLSRFVSQSGSQWHLCLLNGNEFDRFPQRLADALKSETPASEQELFSEWAARTDNSQLLVIIVDNSEQMDDNAFERLCALLEQGNANRIRLILFGSPAAQQAYRQAFEQKQLAFSAQLLEMPRMSEEETASYLTYRLAVAGYSGENPFTATEIRAICKASDGRPAAINQLAHQALVEHQARAGSKHVRLRQGTRKAGSLTWGLGSGAILVLTIWLGWQKFYPPAADRIPVAQAPMEERPLAIPEPAPLAKPAPPVAPVESPVNPETPQARAVRDEPGAETGPLATAESALNASRPDHADRKSLAETPTTADVDGETLPAPADEQPYAATRTTELATEAGTPDSMPDTGSPSPADIAKPETAMQAAQATAELPTPKPAAEAAPATADTPASKVATEPATTEEPLPHREHWLLQQPEAAFTLQLLGSRNADSINRYLEQHRLDKSQTAIYRGLYKGAEWYVLLYGIYTSRQAAIDARAALPPAIRKDKPWPRTLKTVHSAIHEVQ